VRVVIAEDLALLRDGLIRLFSANDFEVVEAVDNGPMLLAALMRHRPDMAVIDVRLPSGFTDEGLRAAREARRRVPGLPLLILPSTSSSCMPGNCCPTAPEASATR
jgi:DNA-binding NarL/FixJ family response regulator